MENPKKILFISLAIDVGPSTVRRKLWMGHEPF